MNAGALKFRGAFCALLLKDSLLLIRSAPAAIGALVFGLTLVVMASFGLREALILQAELPRVLAVLHWLLLSFSGVMILRQAFQAEMEEGALQSLFLTGLDAGLIFLAKWLILSLNLLALSGVLILSEVLLLDAAFKFSALNFFGLSALFVAGFSAVGAVLSCLAARSTVSALLLPLLLFPLLVPLLCALIWLSLQLIAANAFPFGSFWFTFAAVYDVLAVVLAWSLFPYLFGRRQ